MSAEWVVDLVGESDWEETGAFEGTGGCKASGTAGSCVGLGSQIPDDLGQRVETTVNRRAARPGHGRHDRQRPSVRPVRHAGPWSRRCLLDHEASKVASIPATILRLRHHRPSHRSPIGSFLSVQSRFKCCISRWICTAGAPNATLC